MKALIGFTGFVGSNLNSDIYQYVFNSKNIEEILKYNFDQIVCAGVRAEKFLANAYPTQDLQSIDQLIEILKKVKCNQFILISTIDIYKEPNGVDENTYIDTNNLHPYGANRYHMEQFVRSHFEDYLIVRLPALFGKGLKKNFIYDMIHKIPTMIMKNKMIELETIGTVEDQQQLLKCYDKNAQGDYILRNDINDKERLVLKRRLEKLGFTSLIFTDSRSMFPFYDLSNLQRDIDIAIENGIKELNIAVEPITSEEIARECFGVEFNNKIQGKQPIYYDMKSIHADKWNGKQGYLYSKDQTLSQITKFIREYI